MPTMTLGTEWSLKKHLLRDYVDGHWYTSIACYTSWTSHFSFCFICFGYPGCLLLQTGLLYLWQLRAALQRQCTGFSLCWPLTVERRLFAHRVQRPWGTGVASPQHVRHSRTRAGTQVPYIGRQIPNHWTTRQVPSLFSLANRTQFGLNNRLLCASWPLSQLQGGVRWLFKYNYGHLTTPASDWFRYVGVCNPGQWGVRQVCLVGGFWEKVPFFLYFLKIEVGLIYNGVLVSGVHQSDSVYIYTHLLLFQIPFPYSYCKTWV